MTSAISYPFTIDTFGNTVATTDIVKIYTDRLLTLLSTNIGQRPILQSYGTDIMNALFENDNDFPLAVDQAIRQAVAKWIPEIEIADITVDVSDREGSAPVNITIVLPDSTTASVNLSTATFNIDGSVTR